MERIWTFLRSSTDALSERPFRLLWLGQTGSAIGDALVGVALAFAVLEVGGTAGDLGLVFAAFAVPRVVLILAGGVWSDRLPRQQVMVACDLARAATQAVVATLLITGHGQVWHLVALGAVSGAAQAFFVPATVGLMPEVVSRPRLQQANALVSLSQSAAHVFGPLAAGLLVATVGPGWAFAVDGASFVLSAGFLLALRIPPRIVEERRPFLAELADGWQEVVSRRWVVASIAAFALSNASLASFQVLGPVVASRELGGAAAWGAILAGGSVGGLIGGAIALRWKPRRPLVPAFGVMAIASVQLLVLVPPFPVAVVALGSMVAFAGIVISNAFWDTMLQQHIPPTAMSRVSSYDWMASLALQPIAFAAVGPMSEVIGTGETLLLAAGLGIAANTAVLLVPSVRNLTRREGTGLATPTPAEVAAASTAPGSPAGSAPTGGSRPAE